MVVHLSVVCTLSQGREGLGAARSRGATLNEGQLSPGYNICPSLISPEQSYLTVGQAYLVHSAPFD